MLLILGLVIESGADDCSAVLIFVISSLKKCPNKLARSVVLTRWGKIMVKDLCRILLLFSILLQAVVLQSVLILPVLNIMYKT